MTVAATTVKLPASLKKRVGQLAKSSGKSSHAWLVDAIEAVAVREEEERAFYARARSSKRAVDAGEPVYELEDVLSWVEATVSGRHAGKPVARKR